MNQNVKTASELFTRGLYCSQAVLGAFSKKYDMEEKLALRISCGLNSGVRCSEVCGAVSGAILVIGLKYGDVSSVCNVKTEEYIQAFKDLNGSIVCRDILGLDISTPDGKEKAVNENLFKTRCLDMVRDAVQLLVHLGY
jgi:C_GCAxxG_C_C family probable redox protein